MLMKITNNEKGNVKVYFTRKQINNKQRLAGAIKVQHEDGLRVPVRRTGAVAMCIKTKKKEKWPRLEATYFDPAKTSEQGA